MPFRLAPLAGLAHAGVQGRVQVVDPMSTKGLEYDADRGRRPSCDRARVTRRGACALCGADPCRAPDDGAVAAGVSSRAVKVKTCSRNAVLERIRRRQARDDGQDVDGSAKPPSPPVSPPETQSTSGAVPPPVRTRSGGGRDAPPSVSPLARSLARPGRDLGTRPFVSRVVPRPRSGSVAEEPAHPVGADGEQQRRQPRARVAADEQPVESTKKARCAAESSGSLTLAVGVEAALDLRARRRRGGSGRRATSARRGRRRAGAATRAAASSRPASSSASGSARTTRAVLGRHVAEHPALGAVQARPQVVGRGDRVVGIEVAAGCARPAPRRPGSRR